jgi:hypothetical protein
LLSENAVSANFRLKAHCVESIAERILHVPASHVRWVGSATRRIGFRDGGNGEVIGIL